MRLLLVLLCQTSPVRQTNHVVWNWWSRWPFMCRCRINQPIPCRVWIYGRGVVGVLEDPDRFSSTEFQQLMYNKNSIIAKMRHHCIVPPIPSRMSWNMLPVPMVEPLTASPVDSMTLDAAFPRIPTTFSSRSPTTFKVSWIAPPIALIMELSPCATDSKVAPRALPIYSNVSPSPLSKWRSFSFCIALWTLEKISSIVYGPSLSGEQVSSWSSYPWIRVVWK